jgi:hypothetical protein
MVYCMVSSRNDHSTVGLVILGMVHSRYGLFWEWLVLGVVILGIVVPSVRV